MDCNKLNERGYTSAAGRASLPGSVGVQVAQKTTPPPVESEPRSIGEILVVGGSHAADSSRDKAAPENDKSSGTFQSRRYKLLDAAKHKRPMTWFSHGTCVEQPSPEVCSISR
jgi:hypothetical protein